MSNGPSKESGGGASLPLLFSGVISTQFSSLLISEAESVEATSPTNIQASGALNNAFFTPRLYFGPQVPDSVESLKENYGLSCLKKDDLEFVKSQVQFVCEFLESSENFAMEAPTGSGKTLVALMVASKYLSEDKKVWFITPQGVLVSQVAGNAKLYLDIADEEMIMITGETEPSKRALCYKDPSHKLFIQTPEALVNDLARGAVDLSRAEQKPELIIIDEIHEGVGEHAYVRLSRYFKNIPLRILGLSAYVAESKQELRSRMDCFGLSEFRKLDIPSRPRTVAPLYCPIKEGEVATEMIDAIAHLDRGGERVYQEIHNTLEILSYGVTESQAAAIKAFSGLITKEVTSYGKFCFPPWSGSSSLVQGLKKLEAIITDESKRKFFGRLSSYLAELNELGRQHGYLTSAGIFAFLDYVVGQHNEMVEMRHKGRNVGKYLERLLESDSETVAAFRTLAKGTAYYNVLTAKNRNAIFDRTKLRESLIERDYLDHPKEKKLFELIANEIRISPDAKVVIFTGLVSETLFLAERLNRAGAAAGIKAVAIIGKGKGRPNASERNKIMESFAVGEANVMVGVRNVIGQGLHIPAIKLGIIQEPYPKPTKFEQSLGRVGRGEAQGALYVLITSHVDTIRQQVCMSRHERRAKEFSDL
ncbi:MAG: DEAD/DEAH box helicase family protein [SAR324 cluster bacterium]|uniref:DEAD/DEAH box helicase family protein n=1 Tax=SAR324 cluster bacterium TaxID=2024889 RepID=A0A7X9FTI5_9DELT|nr:DEAD/DEAH box helicase family protein [SAR324 cluster bacterium]